MARAIWNDTVLANSDDTVVVGGNHYFPIESLDRDKFRSSDHRSVCPWKGEASYFDVVVDGDVNPTAAWYYPTPKQAAAEIAGRVAFWRGVRVEAGGERQAG
ncbi:DUF427 domain-containing protein [Iamia sp.]|uniref:DUF427 domain-containing protein n=1 Tax=Iamia sp. TaxID=2722710 RepID=UPI002CD70F8F|nr:DUF427 domain-containing protein [Iamia sp.]HXH56102.1 DUF427 domain-containing protein [Iamia sp.]